MEADLPASGSISVETTWNGTVAPGVAVMSFSNAKQQAEEAVNGGTATGTNVINTNITTITSDAMIVTNAAYASSGTYTSHGAGQIERWDQNPTSATHSGTTESALIIGLQTQSETSSTSSDHAHIVAAFAPFSGFLATIDTLARFYENSDNKVRIDYTLTEPASAACNFTTAATQVQYSTSTGGPWTDAAIYGTTTGADASPGGTAHNTSFEPLYWDATGVANGDYYIRLKPHNGTVYATDYNVSGSTVKVYTPTVDDIMRHGKTFLDEVRQNFHF